MFKHIALVSAFASSVFILSGCTTAPVSLSGIELPEPRPTLNVESARPKS